MLEKSRFRKIGFFQKLFWHFGLQKKGKKDSSPTPYPLEIVGDAKMVLLLSATRRWFHKSLRVEVTYTGIGASPVTRLRCRSATIEREL
jgi:hypothetical protein